MPNNTNIHQIRQEALTREMLSGVRDAALTFLLAYDWDRENTSIPPQRPILSALERLRCELHRLSHKMRGGMT